VYDRRSGTDRGGVWAGDRVRVGEDGREGFCADGGRRGVDEVEERRRRGHAGLGWERFGGILVWVRTNTRSGILISASDMGWV
jgi:hypothetical protein